MPEPIVYEGLCHAPICHRRNDPDWHRCAVCDATAIEHAHIISRAQRPDLKKDPDNLIALCNAHHREVDERQGGTLGHAIRDLPGRGKVYFRFDIKGAVLFEKAIKGAVLSRETAGDADAGSSPVSPLQEGSDGVRESALLAKDGTHPSQESEVGAERQQVRVGSLRVDNKIPYHVNGGPGGLQAVPEALSEGTLDGVHGGCARLAEAEAHQEEAGGARAVGLGVVRNAPLASERQIERRPDLQEVSAPSIPSLTTDWSGYTDEQLAAIYQTSEKAHGGAFLCMCKAVHEYKSRHIQAWGESWLEAAYALFGSIPSRRTLEGYAGFWEVASGSVADTEQVSVIAGSRSLVQAIGRAEKDTRAPVLLEAAVDYAAEYGEAPSVPALLQKVGVESGERVAYRYICRDCGSTNVEREKA